VGVVEDLLNTAGMPIPRNSLSNCNKAILSYMTKYAESVSALTKSVVFDP